MRKTLSAKQISILLTILSIALWSFSLNQANLNLDGYGLIHSLPVSFFVALGLLTIASTILWVSPEDHGMLLFLQLVFLITSLWLTPLLIGGIGNSQPTFAGAFGEFGNVDYIVRHGHFSPDISWRLNWPGVYILAAVVVDVLRIGNPDTLIAVLPFLWQFIILIPLYLIFRNTLGKGRSNYCWAALWVLYVGGWSEVAVLHTQTLSNLLILTMLVIFTTKSAWQAKDWAIASNIGTIFLSACLTITHLMTSLFSLIMLTGLNLVKRIKTINLILIAAVFIGGWLIYVTTVFFEGHLHNFVDKVFKLDLLWSSSVTERVAGNAAHQAVVRIRLLTTILFGVIGVGGLIIGRKNKTSSDATMVAIGVSAIVLAIVIGAGYGWETPQRFFFFIMLPVAYFAIRLLQRKATAAILVFLLIIALPLYFISHYGNQASDYSSPPTMASWHFFNTNTTHGLVVSDSPFGDMKNIEQYKQVYFTQIREKADPLANLPRDYPQYICIGQQDQALFNVIYDKPDFIPKIQASLDSAKNRNLVYDNTDVRIYIEEGRE